MRVLQSVALVAATLTVGLMAGLFSAYAYSVMPGLRRVDDRAFVEVMQRINVAIINGWFLVAFLGGLAFSVLAAALHLAGAARTALPWIVAGVLFYVVALVVTGRVNVPLNNELAAAGPADRAGDLAGVRRRFEDRWVRWNVVRAAMSTAAFGCLVWALVRHGTALG